MYFIYIPIIVVKLNMSALWRVGCLWHADVPFHGFDLEIPSMSVNRVKTSKKW